MAPQPIEDIDLPAVRDRIIECLLVVWTFICDVCLTVWSALCEACWAAWTWPPFETFRNDFMAALIALEDYVVAHPVTSTAFAILAFIVIPGVLNAISVCLLHSLGFRRRGVLRGSYRVANYQSTGYSGNVSRFARFQSQGARGGGRYRAVSDTGSPNRYYD